MYKHTAAICSMSILHMPLLKLKLGPFDGEVNRRYYHSHDLKDATKSRIRRPKQGAELPAHLDSGIYNSGIFYVLKCKIDMNPLRMSEAWFRGGLPHHQAQLAAKTGPSRTFVLKLKQHQTTLLPSTTRVATCDLLHVNTMDCE